MGSEGYCHPVGGMARDGRILSHPYYLFIFNMVPSPTCRSNISVCGQLEVAKLLLQMFKSNAIINIGMLVAQFTLYVMLRSVFVLSWLHFFILISLIFENTCSINVDGECIWRAGWFSSFFHPLISWHQCHRSTMY